MQALELVKNRETREPDPELTAATVQRAQQLGLLLLACGTSANVIRLLPPLTISDELLAEGLDILAQALRTGTSRS